MLFSGFDWISIVYDWLVALVFGRKLHDAQIRFLERVPPGASVLLLGGGTGWLLTKLFTECLPTRVTYLDTSSRMLARATRRVLSQPTSATVMFRVGDESTLRSGEQFDIIVTPFVLDLYTEETLKNQMIPRLNRTLRPDGLWLVTDFVRTNVWWQKALLWAMIRFFRLTAGIETKQLSDWQQLLGEAGLIRQHQQASVAGMVSAEVWGM